jgi:hypothetical protein
MTMKHFAKKQAAILLIALFALAACQNSLDPPENLSGGNVVISIGGEASTARTLWPSDTDLSGLTYQLAFSGDGDASHAAETISRDTPTTVSLAPGNWTITAQAKTGDTVKAEGSWTGDVSAGNTTDVSITLLPKTGSGEGTLAYTVSFPELGAGGSKSLALYAVTENGETAAGDPITNFNSGTSYTVNVPAGFYRLSLSLTNSAGKTAARTDAVHIYAGLNTTAAFSFVEEDFRILVTLDAGPAVQAEAAATTADVTFTGATGLTLSAADFAVDNGASVTNVWVASDTATVSVGFADNTGVTSKTYTVSIVGGSTKIKGSATVAITQAAAVAINAFNLATLVTAPAKNAAPETTDIYREQYTGTIAWQTSSGADFTGSTFAAFTVYKALVTLSAKPGYTFAGVTANSFTYTGASAVSNLANSGTVTITFPATAAAVVNALNLSALLTTPLRDAAPVTTAINTEQYTGTVAWQTSSGADFTGGAFAASTVYKALVTLSANSGYTFADVTADSFTYTGATATNAANSGTVTITFPATGPAEDIVISDFNLTALVIAPAVTATPVTTTINTAEYTGTIAWYTSGGALFTGGTFAATTVYRALVTLSAKPGYTFTGVSVNNFIHMGADTVANGANSGTVTITFPATTAVGSATITVGFNYGEITISDSDGSNVISKSGAYGPSSLSLSATGYTNVIWYVDGSSTGISGSPVTLNATTYSAQRHSIIFTGTANGLRYSSQPIPFAVLP